MLFSIIIPVYNVEKYLNRCIGSLINQTYQNIEIILVDDGSKDNCPRICDEYARMDTRIKVIHKENGGLSDARNAGLIVANGEYILFVDSDDYIEKNTCEMLAGYAQKKYDILVGQAFFEGGEQLRYFAPGEVVYTGKEYMLRLLQSKKGINMAVWFNAYRRRFLLEHALAFKRGIYHEDEQFTPRAFLYAQSVICTEVMFYHYIVKRDGSITAQKDRRKHIRDLYSTCLELEDFYKRNTDGELLRLLLDRSTKIYLDTYRSAKAYKYGKEYSHKKYVKQNAIYPKTKIRSTMFCFSPRLYCWVCNILKL